LSARQFAELQRLGVRTITTALAAAAWHVSTSAASKMLVQLASTGLIEPLRHGVWLIDRDATPESLAAEITSPYPSYVSHVSALHLHGVIDQVPAEVHVVSVAQPRRIRSSRGVYRLHRMPPQLFGGSEDVRGVELATVEKALFDWAYLSSASGASARLPETEWPASFRRARVDAWLSKIANPRLRTMTKSRVDAQLAQHQADREDVAVLDRARQSSAS